MKKLISLAALATLALAVPAFADDKAAPPAAEHKDDKAAAHKDDKAGEKKADKKNKKKSDAKKADDKKADDKADQTK